MDLEKSVVAICGPSGVGKGYIKSKLLSLSCGLYAEPTIVTTRAKRPDDANQTGRKAGVAEKYYDTLVESGAVILDHRPFRRPDTPRYGFDKQSTLTPKPLLTEVHSSILRDFAEHFSSHKLLIIGIFATRTLLSESIRHRGGNMEDLELRIRMSEIEREEMIVAHDDNIISELYVCNQLSRESVQNEAISRIIRFIGGQYD